MEEFYIVNKKSRSGSSLYSVEPDEFTKAINEYMDEQVYCTNCIHSEQIIQWLEDTVSMPKECLNCYPYDIPDSRG